MHTDTHTHTHTHIHTCTYTHTHTHTCIHTYIHTCTCIKKWSFHPQLPPMVNYSMVGRTYRYFEGEPLYPFGYGLSYTTFTYSDLSMPSTVAAGNDLQGQVKVQNAGQVDSDEVRFNFFMFKLENRHEMCHVQNNVMRLLP